ncbi:MAG: VCBS repeat-containing protein [Deltaproteobacteria bacterium]|nr:VCBS repeat-containing protein [Deltaproteobacteria bacterium]
MQKLLVSGGVAAVVTLAALAASSCGDSTSSASGAGTSATGGAGGAAGHQGTGGSGGGLFTDGGDAGCTPGESCGDGGVCTADGACCAKDRACGKECCGDEQVCSFQKCAVPGESCVDVSDCQAGEYCEYALGEPSEPDGGADASCQGGVVPPTGKCLPKPPACAPNEEPGEPPSCLQKCELKPPTSELDPEVKHSWGGQTSYPYSTDVMMTPIVVQLDDDNCDGKVTADDIPEIAFSTFTGGGYYRPGTLHVISLVGGQLVEKWSKPGGVQASTGLAAGDLDGDGVAELVACAAPSIPNGNSCCDAVAQNTGVVAFKANGDVLWTQADTTKVHCGYENPAVADPTGSGAPLVLVGLTLLDGKTGAVVQELDPQTSWGIHLTSFADIDQDGVLDVVEGQRAYKIDGTPLWDLRSGPDAIPFGYHAVGDLDLDGKPEVVVISSGGPHTAQVIGFDPASPAKVKVIRKGIDINHGESTKIFCNTQSEYGGGPPTVADFDGDGVPDVGAAGAVGYVVLSGKQLMNPSVDNKDTVLWFKKTQDCSSACTGSAVFDFNGDGSAEVVYRDEVHLWMYDGKTGTQLIPDTCLTSGTLWDYPVIADVDNDGKADIVVPTNAYALSCNGTKQSGILILGSKSGSWVRTRRVWNQHTYHVTNVGEDGSIPAKEKPNWKQPGLNNFRQNKQPGGEFSAPDLVVSVFPKCAGEYGLFARVRNMGEASVPPGVVVGFYQGKPPDGVKLGEKATTLPLYSLGSEDLLFVPQGGQPPDLVYAVVDDDGPPHDWKECRTDNNTSAAADPKCAVAR